MRSAIASHWRSPLAIGLALAHAIAFLLIVFSEQPLPPPGDEECADSTGVGCMDVYWGTFGIRLMGREFHHDRAFYALSLIDLPPLLVAGGLEFAIDLTTVRLSPVSRSYLSGWLLLALGTAQWWMAGVLATAHRRARTRQRTLVRKNGVTE